MKIVLWVLGLLVGLLSLFLLVQTLASERVEVVELYTLDESGAEQTTRLWVMDFEGFQYLRVGAEGSGWFTRIQQNGQIRLMRGSETASYTVAQRPEKSEAINRLMAQKYTWGDDFFALMLGSREGSIPLELHPVE